MLTHPLQFEFLGGRQSTAILMTQGSSTAPIAIAGFLCWALAGFPRHLEGSLSGDPRAVLVLGMTFQERQGRLPRIVRRLSPLGDGSLYLLHNLMLDLTYVALLAVGASDWHGWGWPPWRSSSAVSPPRSPNASPRHRRWRPSSDFAAPQWPASPWAEQPIARIQRRSW